MSGSARNLSPRPLFAGIAFAGIIVISSFAAHAQPTAVKPQGPSARGSSAALQATISAFYSWYLEAIAQQRNPIHDDQGKMESYVSKPLLRKIDKQINSPEGLDEDYFIKAQDYLNDWMTNIVVSDVQIHGKVASAIVTLGATKQSRQSLSLKLVQEGESWKISKVTQPDTPQTKVTREPPRR